MPYFNTERIFLVPSLDLEVKEKEKMTKFLTLLDNSGVGEIINKYIKNKSKSGGRPSYNYYRLFATIIYGFAFDRYTLRELEDACRFDIRYIYLMEQETPRYTKFCEFINKVIVPNEEEIFSLINLEIQKETGIVFDDAFIDGTKYEANANKYKFVWKPIKHHKNLSIKIGNIIKEHNLIANYNNEVMIKSSTVAYAITHLKEKENEFDKTTFYKLHKTLSALLDKVMEYEEKEEICGPNRKSYYKTDHAATAMALKADYYSGLGSNMHAAYNVQLLVIMGYIFSYHVSQERTDINVFIDVIDRLYSKCTENNLGLRIVLEPNIPIEKLEFIEGPVYVIMCYNLHYSATEPGEKANPDFINELMDKMEKIPGIKDFAVASGGFDWREDGQVTSIDEIKAEELINKHNIKKNRDSNSKCINFEYIDEQNEKHEVWYADKYTLNSWMELINDRGYKISLWKLGGNKF